MPPRLRRRIRGHFPYPLGNAPFFFIGLQRIHIGLAAVIIGTKLPHGERFSQHIPQHQLFRPQDEGRPVDELPIGNTYVAVLRHVLKDIRQARRQPLRRLRVHAVRQGNLVGRFKADAVYFGNHAVRLLCQHIQGFFAVFLHEPRRIAPRHAVGLQIQGQVVDLLFFIKRFRNDGQLFRADAFDFQQAFWFLFHDGHRLAAEGRYDTAGQRRSDALYGARRQKPLDAVGRIGNEALPRRRRHLAAILFMLGPPAHDFYAVSNQRLRAISRNRQQGLVVFAPNAEDYIIRIGGLKQNAFYRPLHRFHICHIYNFIYSRS